MLLDNHHLDRFVEFSGRFIALGGPDPHVKIVARAAQDLDEDDALWLVICYISVYTIGAATALFHLTRDTDPDTWLDLITTHRKGFPMRRERRAVWNPAKLAESLVSCRHWLDANRGSLTGTPYDDLWSSAKDELRYFGRYAVMKLLGTLEHAQLVSARQPDIRPHGAWSTRAALAKLVPHEHELLVENTSSRSAVLAEVNEIAEEVRVAHAEGLGLEAPLDYFTYETLLCNYRQAIGSKGKYVGSSHDSELGYWQRTQMYWGETLDLEDVLPFYDVRSEIFDHRALAERSPCYRAGGWTGPRKELNGTLARFGYWWSDLEYDYCATTDLEEPVRWDD